MYPYRYVLLHSDVPLQDEKYIKCKTFRRFVLRIVEMKLAGRRLFKWIKSNEIFAISAQNSSSLQEISAGQKAMKI